MAFVLADRVRETTTTTGTGSVTLLGAVSGYQSFSAIGNANTTYYVIAGQTTSEWEVGVGTYTSSGTTLARTTVLASSNSGSLVNFSAGTKDVWVDYPAGKAVIQDASSNVSVPANFSLTGTAARITGDFSTSTFANRVAFQSSTVDGATAIIAIPNGTSNSSSIQAVGASDPSATSRTTMSVSSTESRFEAGRTASGGTYLPMTFYSSGTEKLRIAADATGTFTFGGTAPRITGDFSNGTQASRALFQTSTANSTTSIGAIPSGTGTTAAWNVYNNSDPTNASYTQVRATSTDSSILAGLTGTGTYLPMTFITGGSERIRIDTSGNVSIGTATPSTKLTVYGTTTTGSSISAECADAGAASGPYLDLYRNSASPAANDSLGAIFFDGNNSSANIIGYATIKNIIGSPTAASESGILTFSAYAAGSDGERMRIHSNGYIGIANNSPACALDVTGGIQTSRTTVTSPATTDGNIFSGSYTPTFTNTTNISSSTPVTCYYTRVGNVVSVFGRVDVTATATGNTVLGVSLPIASNLTTNAQLSGTVATTSATVANNVSGRINGDTTNDRAQVQWNAAVTTAVTYSINFSYVIV